MKEQAIKAIEAEIEHLRRQAAILVGLDSVVGFAAAEFGVSPEMLREGGSLRSKRARNLCFGILHSEGLSAKQISQAFDHYLRTAQHGIMEANLKFPHLIAKYHELHTRKP